ncbi:hypothetical protein GQ457_16G002050 [Hibiscus cannabinus]
MTVKNHRHRSHRHRPAEEVTFAAAAAEEEDRVDHHKENKSHNRTYLDNWYYYPTCSKTTNPSLVLLLHHHDDDKSPPLAWSLSHLTPTSTPTPTKMAEPSGRHLNLRRAKRSPAGDFRWIIGEIELSIPAT